MASTKTRCGRGRRGAVSDMDVTVKREPVDTNSYSSLPVHDTDPEQSGRVSLELGRRSKIEPGTDESPRIKKEPKADESDDEEPISTSELTALRSKGQLVRSSGTRTRTARSKNVQPSVNYPRAASSGEQDGGQEVIDLTEEEQVAASWLIREKTVEEARSGKKADSDGTRRGIESIGTPISSKLAAELVINGTERLAFGSKPRFFRRSSFNTRIAKDYGKAKSEDLKKAQKQHQQMEESMDRKRSEAWVGMDRVKSTPESPARVEKSKRKKMQSGAERKKDEQYLQRGLINDSAEIGEGEKESKPTRAAVATNDAMDVDDGPYCTCGHRSYRDMICCDNDSCDIQWFHPECVGLKAVTKGRWLCPGCRKLPTPKVSKGGNDEVASLPEHRNEPSTGQRRSTRQVSSKHRVETPTGGRLYWRSTLVSRSIDKDIER